MLDGLMGFSTLQAPNTEQHTSTRCIKIAKVLSEVVVIDIEVQVVMALILLVRCVR
jgi:hypothetical protein